jgi:uncharacterized protein Yka (UPF0111/DUF47 family)
MTTIDTLKKKNKETFIHFLMGVHGFTKQEEIDSAQKCIDEAVEWFDGMTDNIATTLTDEMIHEWNKAEQQLDGTTQGVVNAIEQYRNYLAQVKTNIKKVKKIEHEYNNWNSVSNN